LKNGQRLRLKKSFSALLLTENNETKEAGFIAGKNSECEVTK